MIIADMISAEIGGGRVARVYLTTVPLPGDVVRVALMGDFVVARRLFIDLGPGLESGSDGSRLSVELTVKPV